MSMRPFFGYHTNYYGMDAVIGSVAGSVLIISLMISIAFFLLKGYNLFGIARRRGLKKAWLSWIPVGQDWIRGSISDQYCYLTAGKIQHRRVILSVVSAVYLILGTAGVIMMIRHLSLAVAGMIGLGNPHQAGYHLSHVIITAGSLGFVTIFIWIARIILHHMCMYDLYRSADPNNDTVMTVLGIVVPVLEIFFLFYVREKDDGMPPRRDRPNGNAQRPYHPGPERPVDPVYNTPTDGPEQL